MSLISYAQNLEDVLLWRALKNSVTQGFYIDVGAWLATQDSVTYLFYEKGWRGINIEPSPVYYADLVEKRPEDINLSLVISDQDGLCEFHTIDDTGPTTQQNLAHEWQKQGFSSKKKYKTAISFSTLWEKYVPAGQEVHFLKIDVEGHEASVLKGINFATYQPWIVLIESVDPLTHQENHLAWEFILLEAGYQFAYADGLNRFYIAPAHLNLLDHFKYPPNVFDGFIIYNHLRPLLLQTERQEEQINKICKTFNLNDRLELTQILVQYTELLNSTSWRITAPIRFFKKIWVRYFRHFKNKLASI